MSFIDNALDLRGNLAEKRVELFFGQTVNRRALVGFSEFLGQLLNDCLKLLFTGCSCAVNIHFVQTLSQRLVAVNKRLRPSWNCIAPLLLCLNGLHAPLLSALRAAPVINFNPVFQTVLRLIIVYGCLLGFSRTAVAVAFNNLLDGYPLDSGCDLLSGCHSLSQFVGNPVQDSFTDPLKFGFQCF